MKRKSLKIFVLGLSVAMGISMLVGCSSEGGSSSTSVSSNKLNIAVKDKYVVNSKDNKYGVMSFDKKQVIPCKYDYLVYVSSADLFIATKDGKDGVIDINEKEILPFEYALVNLSSTEDKLYATDYKTTTVFNFDGKQEKVLEYGFVRNTGKGTAIVGKNIKKTDQGLTGNYGLIDETGKEILKPEYSDYSFIADYDKKTKGNEFISIYFEKDGKAGVYSVTGDVIIPLEYKASEQLNRMDEYVITQSKYYIKYNGFTQSYLVNKNDKFGIIDRKGKEIIETKYDFIDGSHKGYIATLDEKDTVYDLKGNVMLSDDTLDIVGISEDGLISVTKNGESYYVDSKGNKVEIEGLKDIGSIAHLNTLDKQGNAVVEFSGANEEIALISKQGKVLIGPLKENEGEMLNISKFGETNENFSDFYLYDSWRDFALGSSDYLVRVGKLDENNTYRYTSSSLYNKEGKKLADFDGEISWLPLSDKFYKISVIENDNYLYGLMDRSGKVIVNPTYAYIDNTYDDYLVAQKGDKYILLDKETGKVVLEY